MSVGLKTFFGAVLVLAVLASGLLGAAFGWRAAAASATATLVSVVALMLGQYLARRHDGTAQGDTGEPGHAEKLELVQSQKMASLGTLAAGIAHEINTPMQFIGDNLRFLRDVVDEVIAAGPDGRLPDDFREEAPGAIEDSLEGVARVGQIVGSMRRFAHPDPLTPEPNDLNESVQVTTNVSRALWKQVARLELDLDETLPAVPCKPGEINQVLLNLIANAADAIAEHRNPGTRGTITIATRRAGDMAEISVRDDGSGIPQDLQQRIFAMFFTTKPAGEGTGQGLAIAAAIVANHQGRIDVESAPGQGSCFRVLLPISRPD